MAETTSRPDPSSTVLIWVGIGAFVLTGAVAMTAGYFWGGPKTAHPGFPLSERAVSVGDGMYQVTLDTADNEQWVGFSFALGRTVPSGLAADVLIRRHYWRAPGGAAHLDTDLAHAAVDADPDWSHDELVDRIPMNPVLNDWYDYGYWTHLLTTKDEVYVVRSVDPNAGPVALEMVSYYCDPEGSGCMTFRYRPLMPRT